MMLGKYCAVIAFFITLSTFLFIGPLQAQNGQNNESGELIGQSGDHRVITTAVPFLAIAPDSRAASMGDAGVATSPDANSTYWNAGKLVFVENDMGASISYTPWLSKLVNDMSISYLSGYKKITREQAVAVSMRYFDLGGIEFTDDNGNSLGEGSPSEIALSGTYSRMLSSKLGVGVTFRFVRSNLTGGFSFSNGSGAAQQAPAANTVAADIGMYYKTPVSFSTTDSELAFGANISNIGRKMTYSGEDEARYIPGNLRIGTAYTMNLDPYNSLSFALDFNKLLVPTPPIADGDSVISGKDPERPLLSGTFGSFTDAPDGFSEELKEVMVSIGMEYWYTDVFSARVGYFHEHEEKGNRKFLSFGVGFRYQVFGLDFAYMQPIEREHPLANTLRFTLLFNFKDFKTNETIQDS